MEKNCKNCGKRFEVKHNKKALTCSVDCWQENKKKQVPWNKGVPCREVTKEKIKESMLKQYKDGTRDAKEITRKANETLRKRTKEREANGTMNTRIDVYGYKLIYTTKGWKKEHHYIWEKFYGPIPKGMVLHHINKNKQDNRITNLKMMKKGQHMKEEHKFERDSNGRFVRQEE